MKKKLIIKGMSCKHCEMRVEKSLLNLDGVKKVKVSFVKNEAIITLDQQIENYVFFDCIKDAGYELITIEELA